VKGQREQVIFKGRRTAAQATLQPPQLARPIFDALSQSLKVRRQDRALFTHAHRARGGICLQCGMPLLQHFSERNERLECAQVAQEG